MKRVLSIILATLLIVSVFPLAIFAETSNGFQTNFAIKVLDEKWNSKNDGSGDNYNLLQLDYQVKGEHLSGAHGAWLAIDLSQLFLVSSRNGLSCDGSSLTAGGSSVKLTGSKYYYTLKESWEDIEFDEEIGDFVDVGDVWGFNYSDNYVALSEDGKTLYLGTQPDQSYSVNYSELTTIVSFRLAVRPGVTIESDAIRYISASERDALNQSFVILMNDGTNEYSYGGIDGENDFGIVDFTGDAGISGRPTIHAEAPTFTKIPQNADFYIDYTSAEDTTLTAEATVNDGGTVTYEWFKNNENKNEGGQSVGTGDKLAIPTNALLDAYYYVVATNTNNSEVINGNKTASVTSEAVHVTVSKHPDRIAIEDAQAALEAIEWADIAQATANTEDTVRAIIAEIAKAAVNNENVKIEVTISDFAAAVAGSAATSHEGTNGKAKFSVAASIGEESYTLSAKEIAIIATYFDGKTHAEMIDEAVVAFESITWSDIAQETANTKDSVADVIKNLVENKINNGEIKVEVDVSIFEAAIAGSAATSHEGTSGYAIFTVKISVGEEIYTSETLDVMIVATFYDGMTHEEIMDEAAHAIDTINWEDIAQETANTEAALKEYLEAIAKEAVGRDDVKVEVTINAFGAAVAGSAETTHEGEDGYVQFKVTATIGEETYTTGFESVTIVATYFAGETHKETIEAAASELESIIWDDILQETANEQDTVTDLLKKIAEDAVANEDVSVVVLIDTFVPATAGAANLSHEGVNGKVTFFVKAYIGKEIYTLDLKSVNIIATYFDGQLDSEAIAEAQTKLEAITWENIAQADANTEEAVAAYIESIAKAAVSNDKITIKAEVTAFTAAVAGSAATTHEGTNGIATFTVTATIGDEAYSVGATVAIIATYFDGVLDIDAVNAALSVIEAITWEDVAQADANTEDAVRAIIEEIANAAVTDESVTVKVEIIGFTAAVAGSAATTHEGTNGEVSFAVVLSRGDACEARVTFFNIIATYFDGQLDSEAIAEAQAKLDAITWSDIAQADANTEEAVKAYIEAIAKAAVNNENVTLEVEILDGDAAIAGSAATTHEGTNGYVEFKIKATCGAETAYAEADEFEIIATYFDGLLNSEAVADAKAKLDAITWSDIAQADANTEEAVKAYIEAIAKAAVNNENVTLEVEILDGDAAVAGSAATTHEGRNGYVEFKIKATCGAETAYAEADEFEIIATYFDGVLDSEAIAEAQTKLEALTWADIAQADANTEDAVKAIIEAIVADTLKNDNITIEVAISDFEEAVAGSAATTHEGENGSATFTVTVSLGDESYTLSANVVAIVATFFDGFLDVEVVAGAGVKVDGLTWSDIAQADANTEDAVRAIIENIAKTALADDSITVYVEIIGFTAAIEGTASSTHEGVNGDVVFKIQVSRGEAYNWTDSKEINIIATYFDGVLDSEAIAEAQTKLEALTWADIAQADANTEDAVKAIIEAIVADTLKNDKFTIEVVISGFTAATAGSAATSHEGENGFAKFSVTVSLGEESYTLSAKEVAIIATFFNGVLDVEAVADANVKVDTLTWSDIAQADANTEEDVKAYIEAIAKTAVADDSVTVHAEILGFITAEAGSAASTHEGVNGYVVFQVQVSRGEAYEWSNTKEIEIIATYFDGKLDSEAVADAKAKLNEFAWSDIAQADANTEEDVKAYIEAIAKAAIADDSVTVHVEIIGFTAAVAGSAATTHEGENGYVVFQLFISRAGAQDASDADEVKVIATYFDGVLDSEAIAEAQTKLNALTWADIAQAEANTEEDVKAIIEAIVADTLKNDNLTVEVVISDFTAAVAGSAATSHEGTNGKATFTVKVSLGEESYTLSAKEVAIIATYFDGVLDSEAIAEAETKLNAITWADIAQEDANTEDAVKAIIEAIVADTLKNDNLTVEVVISDFTAAVAGSAATTHEGTDGYAKFSVKVSLGEESYTLADQNVNIIATYFDGVLDSEAIAEAETKLEALTWADIAQEEANDWDSVAALLKEIAENAVANDTIEITVLIDTFAPATAGSAATTHEGVNGGVKFFVKAVIGGESYTLPATTVAIIATYFDGVLDSEAVADAQAKVDAIVWADIAEEDGNTTDAVRAIIENIAKNAVGNDKITVSVAVTDFTAAVAGSAATTHEGTNGSATFTVTVSLGDESYTTSAQTIAIVATYFDGVLDSEAVADAQAKVDAIVWADIAEEDGNTTDAVRAIIENIAKNAVGNDKITVSVAVTDFTAAVAGSAATSHEGTNGSATFTVTVSLGDESYTTSAQAIAIVATYFDGVLDSEAVADAQAKVDAIVWADIAEEDGNTTDAVRAIIENIAKNAVGNDKITVSVAVTDFTAAVAGSAATSHEGTNGSATFTVTVSLGDESYTTSAQTIAIIATYFDGVLDADAIEEIKQILDSAIWEYISQVEANTEETVKAFLEAVAADMIANDNVTVEVAIDEFAAAVAGSAATTHDGENGYAKFSVTATIGSESYTVSGQQVAILATIFNGILDSEAVADAYDKVVGGGEVNVKYRATKEEIEEAVAQFVRALLTGDAAGVTVSVSRESESAFKVTLTKGSESLEKTIEMTVIEEQPVKLQTPTNLTFKKGVAVWDKVDNAFGYKVTLYSVKNDTMTLVKTETVSTNKYSFASMIKDNVAYVFDVVALGNGDYYLDSDTSEYSDIYKNEVNAVVNQVVSDMLAMRNRRFDIDASAGFGGYISDAGTSRVKFGLEKTYKITANEGYEIVSVIVDGEDVGAVSEYRFTNVRREHTIHVIFAELSWNNPFTDVSTEDSYYDAVEFVYENGLFKGTSATEFEPETTMTRAMFVTVLWRLEGEPVVNYLMQFSDVEADTWYTEAVRWASAEGIVNGYGDGTFGVDDEITVEQAAVIIARYATGNSNYKIGSVNLKNYADGELVSYWAQDQMKWALENELYDSVAGYLKPQSAASRALVAEMIYRYVVAFGK